MENVFSLFKMLQKKTNKSGINFAGVDSYFNKIMMSLLN